MGGIFGLKIYLLVAHVFLCLVFPTYKRRQICRILPQYSGRGWRVFFWERLEGELMKVSTHVASTWASSQVT